jgi:hypothetical protein
LSLACVWTGTPERRGEGIIGMGAAGISGIINIGIYTGSTSMSINISMSISTIVSNTTYIATSMSGYEAS